MGRGTAGDEALRDRILHQVQQDAATGCWVWLGGLVRVKGGLQGRRRDSAGYPYLKVAGRLRTVRRLAYELWGRRPALGDRTVRNTCGDPSCVCPTHLVPGKSGKSPGPPRKGTDREVTAGTGV